ncbi:alpha/beta hydrolase [Bacteriovorax sp. PP10]|uniref:Alpha/beta hydrolase n=1 Tax=Bacteriovorax antarcticus TaxID=3088717 RepID=A0ABU5VYT0_9BACT|nr:alpha/beta hydrolase [Bacteriovorax sp. PP10]MEA9358156.1 alpha/beta hydrolase [Bacteriovorax sp. PP10]
MKKIILLLLLGLVLISCSSHEKAPEVTENIKKITEAPVTPDIPEEPINLDLELQEKLQGVWKQYFVEEFNDTRSVNVMVVTNRQFKGKGFGCTDDYFGTGADANFRLGVCRVNVPRNHSTGEISFTANQRESSHDYFKILAQKELNLATLVDYLKKAKRSPLLFVHGFNVKHQEAVLRASQITYDLKYQGPVILFSWPAGAGDSFLDEKLIQRTYAANLKTAQSSVGLFKLFVSKLIENKIIPNIVVHSMGHQVVLPALFELGKNGQLQVTDSQMPLGEVILNAPDFDSDLFVKNIEVIKNLSRRVTLYCSYNDKAMFASETINSSKRLGGCTYMEGVDSINVSLLDNSTFGLNHGYYASRQILTDVFQVLLGIEADRRLFMKKSEPNSTEKYYLRP